MSKQGWKKLKSGFLAALPSKLRMSVIAGQSEPKDSGDTPDQAEQNAGTEPPSLVATYCSILKNQGKTHWTLEYDEAIRNETLPDTFDLGVYLNREKDEYQIAKVAQKDRATHLYVVGATGSGKTKFLEFLIRQDIINGEGFGVIDPHGDLIDEIKGFFSYLYKQDGDERAITDRVVLIDPTDPKQTVTFNPLEPMAGVSVAEQAGELISAFKKIWSDSWGTRMEDLLRNALIALGEAELTLCELTPFLTRRPYRSSVLHKVTNPTAIDYFERFDILTDRSQVTWIEPVMNKMNAFMADERMRQMFSSPKSSFDLREIMDHKKHLLIKLDKGKLKGASDLLGSLFMAKIQMAAFSRSGVPVNKRVPFYLYIDEFQNFASDSFEVILSEARKYGLSLVMAHQSLSQIPDSLRSLILASAGLQVYFRVNRQDAQLLAKEVFRYAESGGKTKGSGNSDHGWESKIDNLQHLPPRTCYAKHKIEGGTLELHTVGLEPAWRMLAISEDRYLASLPTVPFGSKYLRLRDELAQEAEKRKQAIAEAAKVKPRRQKDDSDQTPSERQPVDNQPALVIAEPTEIEPAEVQIVPPVPEPEEEVKPVKERAPRTRTTQKREVSAPADPVIEREHRRLQHLIKRLAEQHGYRATIEEPTADGQGRVDVGLERDGRKVACEISVTSTAEQELGNIEKCLASGYERVILCAEKKSITKIKRLTGAKLSESDQGKVVFIEPDQLPFYFEEEAAGRAGKEERVKGYKVKVNFQPMDEGEKETKRQALARVFVQSTQRKDKKE